MIERETVIEMCPHCENEIEMVWDTQKMGFKSFCPVCGNVLMLCDECQNAVIEDGEPRSCDWCQNTRSCHQNPAVQTLTVEEIDKEDVVFAYRRDEAIGYRLVLKKEVSPDGKTEITNESGARLPVEPLLKKGWRFWRTLDLQKQDKIVHCGECKYRSKETPYTRAGFCGRREAGDFLAVSPTDFCSFGVRE